MTTASTVTQQLPNLLLVGVKKAGTTSLADYLGQHPDICPGDVKAVNHFREVGTGSLGSYAAHWAHAAGEAYRLESPTTYFYGGRTMAEQLADVLPDPHVVVSLRDPVARLWSDYHMKRREDPALLGAVDFESYVDRSEAAYRDGDLARDPGYAAFGRGMYADVAEPWFDVFGQRFRVVFVEQWSRDPRSAVAALVRWLGIDELPVADMQFGVRNPQRDFHSRRVARVARGTYRAATRVVPAVVGLKPALVRAHDRLNVREAAGESMSPAMRQRLRAAYTESNAALAHLLLDHGHHDLPAWLRP